MELTCGILKVVSTISEDDVQDINVLLGHLSGNAPRVSLADLLEVAARNHLFLISDLDAPRGDGYRIVAMATLVPKRQLMGHFGFVEDVVTHPDYERRGISTWLNQQIVEHARRIGMRHLDLTSNPEREAANRLYQKLGYERRDTNVYRKKLT
ncbi:MAG: GNAT family N-acetyltransferase [Candidatus Liptonbacteria bacterium]|nr:GNAT family N-acetyltransferase [Candidatus Liptonbacteria bacterium]